MNIYDSIIVKLFWDFELNRGNSNYRRYNQLKRLGKYSNISNYLSNRFNDSESDIETLLRLVYKIYERPVCPICGKSVKFIGKPNNKGIYKIHCSHSCSSKDKNTINKAHTASINRYGSVNNTNKNKQTKLERYGDENYNNRKQALQHMDYKKSLLKGKQTKLERYGDPYWSNHSKTIETNKIRYGGNSPYNSKLVRDKGIESMKKNKTIGNQISIEEQNIANMIMQYYPDLIQQYTSSEYPFTVDYYIPSIDTYIEYQGHWTHGGHPYDPIIDNDKIEVWKSKQTKFYDNAIQTWTVRDPQKRKTALNNNLNFIEFWNIDDVKCWLEKSII